MALNEKQKLFVKEYLVDMNATQAAIRAGYSETSAAQQAYDLLRNPKIDQLIKDQGGKRMAKLDISADRGSSSGPPDRKNQMTKFNFKPASRNGRIASVVRDLDWYALTVPPQKEFAAQEILHRRGVSSFCPFESLWRQKSRYTREKELRNFPVMPRYVFAGFERDPENPVSWYHVFQIPLITSVVGFEGEPKQVANMADFIARFRNGLKRPDAEAKMRTHREYGVGDLVSFVEGPFSDLTVRVDDISNGHAFFTIGMFGSDRQMSVPLEKLEAA